MELARDYLASFDDYELRFLPDRCRPRVLLCANDVSTYAFDLMAQYVEQGVSLPPSQCIPRGGAIAAAPAQPGHCASLFVP